MMPEWKAMYHHAVISVALAALPEYADRIDPAWIPGLRRYLEERIETGGFLRAVLENNLGEAIARAHPCVTMEQFKSLFELLHNYFPANAYGSPESVAAWLAERNE